MTGADAIVHGATGKGNDQVRFELGAYALRPDIRIIAPWREWDLLSREKLLAYAERHGIPVEMKHRQGGSPYSMDANLLHISYEGRHLEDPAAEAEESMWRWTVSPEAAPDAAEYVDLEFAKGDLVAINGKRLPAHELLALLNQLGGKHGVGRIDLVENRYVGMKSRGCYETPGGTILLPAHRAIESITLDREVAHLKDDLMPRYASLIYNGYWWSPERLALQTLIDHTQQRSMAGCGSSSTRAMSSSSAAIRRPIRCSIRPSPPSRTMPAPTTRRTPAVSSSSTPCACVSRPIWRAAGADPGMIRRCSG
jgi:argininosuccinate synthase